MEQIDIVLYHGHCADGMACAWIFWREDTKNQISYGKCIRDQSPPDVTGKKVVLLDFCYELEEMMTIANQAKSLLIIDHHESSKSLVNKLPINTKIILDTTKSASQLVWEYIYGTNPPWFIDVIAAHDLWKFDANPEYKNISDILYRNGYHSLEKLEELYADTMENGEDRAISRILELEKKRTTKILEADSPEDHLTKKAISEARKNSFITNYKCPNGRTYTVRIVNCDRKIRSEVGNSLCVDCDFAVVWQYDFMTNQWWCSCRANPTKGVDLSQIVSHHGGGGHKLAASFVIYGEKGENLHTYFSLKEIPVHRKADAEKYFIIRS